MIAISLIREKVFLNKAYFFSLILLVFVNLAFFFERLWILETPKIVYEYVQFQKPDQYQVNRLKTDHLQNENLIKAFIYDYVLTKESYPLKNDELETIKAMSSHEMFLLFQDFRKLLKKRIGEKSFSRYTKIKMFQKISDNVRQLELETTDLFGKNKSVKRWKINIRFHFLDEIVRGDKLHVNPTGFKIINYAIAPIQ